MISLSGALEREFGRACDETLESVFAYRDGVFYVLKGGPWETRLYTGERSGRCCFVFSVFPWEKAEDRTTYYYSIGDEVAFAEKIHLVRTGGPVLLARYISECLSSLLEAVGQRAAEDALLEAVAKSVMTS